MTLWIEPRTSLHKANLTQYIPMTNYEVCYLICTMSICVKYLSRMTSQEMEIWCQEVSEEILVNFMIDIYKNTSYLIENEHVNMYRNMKICDGLYMTNLGMKQVLLQNKCFIAIATFFVSYGFFFFLFMYHRYHCLSKSMC